MLKKYFVRDGHRSIIGSVTNVLSDSSSIVRDQRNQITGPTSERFNIVRDAYGILVSSNSADLGLVLAHKK